MKRTILMLVATPLLFLSIAAEAGLPFGVISSFAMESAKVTAAIEREKLNNMQPLDSTPKITPILGANGAVSASQAVALPSRPVTTPNSIRDAVSNQSAEQRSAVAASISGQIAELEAQVNRRLAAKPVTPSTKVEIDALNDAISAKKQALELAQGTALSTTAAAAESYAAVLNPYFLMCKDQFWAPNDILKWREKINPVASKLTTLGRSVGLITLGDRPAGTGVAVGPHHILTNIHVLRLVSDYDSDSKMWKIRQSAKVTFDKEYALGVANKCSEPNNPTSYFINAVYATPNNSDDLAILITSSDSNFPQKVSFSKLNPREYEGNLIVALIGYPGPPEDMTVAEQIEFFHTPTAKSPQFGYKRLSEGYTGTDPVSDGYFVHRANTAGGNSGSPIIDLDTGRVVGLHVMGVNRFEDTLGYNKAIVSDRVISLLNDSGL
ncbi:trypsin-like peptidase domain-containing protein [Cupriavidus sp. 8B]